jgi:hypothetical protein
MSKRETLQDALDRIRATGKRCCLYRCPDGQLALVTEDEPLYDALGYEMAAHHVADINRQVLGLTRADVMAIVASSMRADSRSCN